MKKQEAIDYLEEKGVTYDATMSAAEIKRLVSVYINTSVPIEIVRLAEEQGHKVLLTPPHHSDLNPIKLTWARVKGNIGRQYSNNTTLDIVYECLKNELDALLTAHSTINGMIEKCAVIAKKFHGEMDLEEEIDIDEEDEETDNNVNNALGNDDKSVGSNDDDIEDNIGQLEGV